MSNVLSGVERAIMLKYLQDKLPKMVIKAISTKYIPSEQNLPKFDPLDLQESKYSILDQGIIFFTRNQTSRVIVDNAKICVFFYYNGRGLFFESTLRHVKNGFAIVIPDFIYKQDDIGNGVLQNLKCFLSNSDDESEGKIACVPTDKFSLFTKVDETQIPIQFFSENLLSDTPSVEGRILPPYLLYLSDTELFIGCLTSKIRFAIGETFFLELAIPFAFFERKIYCNATLEDKFQSQNSIEKTCYKFSLSNLKQEDARYLYEKINGSIFE